MIANLKNEERKVANKKVKKKRKENGRKKKIGIIDLLWTCKPQKTYMYANHS